MAMAGRIGGRSVVAVVVGQIVPIFGERRVRNSALAGPILRSNLTQSAASAAKRAVCRSVRTARNRSIAGSVSAVLRDRPKAKKISSGGMLQAVLLRRANSGRNRARSPN